MRRSDVNSDITRRHIGPATVLRNSQLSRLEERRERLTASGRSPPAAFPGGSPHAAGRSYSTSAEDVLGRSVTRSRPRTVRANRAVKDLLA